MTSICLAFLAHNEDPVVFKELRAKLGDRISRWCAVADTDDVVPGIEAAFGDLPGKVHRYPFPQTNGFMDFAKARNRMLDLARRQKADYVLWVDPDDPVEGTIPTTLSAKAYAIRHIGPGSEWIVTHLIRKDVEAHWEGRLHEHLEGVKSEVLEDAVIRRTTSGSATNGLVETQYIPMLYDIIKQDKSDPHAWFYLAQSYKDVGKQAEAAAAYAHRITLGGWAPVVYWCYYQIAEITGSVDDYLLAYNFRPSRVEALHRLAAFYNAREQYIVGRLFAATGLDTAPTSDAMFVERWVETYGLLMELAVAQNGLGEHEQAQRIWEYVLTLDEVQPHHRGICENNLLVKAAA